MSTKKTRTKAVKKAKVALVLRLGFERTHWVHPGLLNFLLAVGCIERDYNVITQIVAGAPSPASAGNVGAWAVLKTQPDVEWIAQVDNDCEPCSNVLDILNEVPNDCGCIGPVSHFMVNNDSKPMQGMITDDETFMPIDLRKPPGLVGPLSRIGGGCWFARRAVYEQMDRPYFAELYDRESWLCKVTDDMYFQDRAKKLGWTLYCDTRFVISHYHTTDLSQIVLKPSEPGAPISYRMTLPMRTAE